MIVLDLEDAVAHQEKTAAREMTRAALPVYTGNTIVSVRVNGADTGRLEDDVEAVMCEDLDLLLIPKVESVDVLPNVDRMIGRAERELGIDAGTTRVLALIETARGLVRIDDIAASATERVIALAFGLVDFAADIGVGLTPDAATELLYARSRVVVAARATGFAAPIDGPYLDLHDFDGLVQNSKRSRQLGFQGRVIIHPLQVEHAHRAYSGLSWQEVEHARSVVAAFEEAEAGGAASIQVDGRFVDYPIYHRAKQQLRAYATLRSQEVDRGLEDGTAPTGRVA